MKSLSSKDFAEIAALVKDWMTVEDIIRLCDEHGFWPLEFIEDSLHELKKVAVRRLARLKTYTDPKGRPIELVSIVQRDRRSKTTTRVYKQLRLFKEDDFVQVINDRWHRRQYWDAETRRFLALAREKYGDQIQEQFPFIDFGEEDSLA